MPKGLNTTGFVRLATPHLTPNYSSVVLLDWLSARPTCRLGMLTTFFYVRAITIFFYWLSSKMANIAKIAPPLVAAFNFGPRSAAPVECRGEVPRVIPGCGFSARGRRVAPVGVLEVGSRSQPRERSRAEILPYRWRAATRRLGVWGCAPGRERRVVAGHHCGVCHPASAPLWEVRFWGDSVAKLF